MNRCCNSILFRILCITWLCISLPGCGGPTRVAAPEFDAVAAAEEAMQLYDSNTDGELDAEELKACAALAGAVDEIDKDSSGTISAAEIQSRVEYFVQGRDGRLSLACYVVKGNTPIRGATVTFEPEPFMADMIQVAYGETNENGMATIHVDDALGNIQPGFYKVRISRQSGNGKEQIKKKFNEESTLGQEITSGSIQLSQGLVFKI